MEIISREKEALATTVALAHVPALWYRKKTTHSKRDHAVAPLAEVRHPPARMPQTHKKVKQYDPIS
jgi:hypothetical protein